MSILTGTIQTLKVIPKRILLELFITIVLLSTIFVYKHKLENVREDFHNYKVQSELNESNRNIKTVEKALEATRKEKQAAENSLKQYKQELEKVLKEKEVTDAKIKEFITRNPDWANQPIPDELRNILKDQGAIH